MLPALTLIGLIAVILAGTALASAVPLNNDYAAYDAAVNALLRDPEKSQRLLAAHQLGLLEDERAIESLAHALRHDPEKDVRAFAAVALGRIGSRDALPHLRYAANNERDLDVRQAAHRAVARIEFRTGPDAARAPIPGVPDLPRGNDLDAGLYRGRGHVRYTTAPSTIIVDTGRSHATRPTIVAGPVRRGSAGAARSLRVREAARRQLLYYYYPDGRPRKYWSGSPSEKPDIYPTPGGQAPLDLLRDPRGAGGVRRSTSSLITPGLLRTAQQRSRAVLSRAQVSASRSSARSSPSASRSVSRGRTRSDRGRALRTVRPAGSRRTTLLGRSAGSSRSIRRTVTPGRRSMADRSRRMHVKRPVWARRSSASGRSSSLTTIRQSSGTRFRALRRR